MSRAEPQPSAREFLWCVVAALTLFVGLMFARERVSAGVVEFQLERERGTSERCGQLTVTGPCDKKSASHVKGVQAYYLCDPDGLSDQNWRALVSWPPAPVSDFGECLVAVADGLRPQAEPFGREWATGALQRRKYGGVVPKGDSLVVQGRPWRTYTAVPLERSPEGELAVAGEPVVIGFYDRDGLNIRLPALGLGVLILVTGCAIAWGLFALRPGRRFGGFWSRFGRTWCIAIVSAIGAGGSGLLQWMLPADLGGFDAFKWDRWWLPLIAAPFGALAGVSLDFARENFHRLGAWGRVGTVTIVAAAAGVTLVVLQAWGSAHGAAAERFSGVQLFHIYYVYLAASLLLPLVVVEGTTLRRRGNQLSPGLLPSPYRATLLFTLALVAAGIASVITVAAGWFLNIPNPGHDPMMFVGFYKPALTIGVLFVAIPVIAAFAVGLTAGEERPVWVQRVDRDISLLLRTEDDVSRTQLALDTMASLLVRVPFGASDRRHLRSVAAAYDKSLRLFVESRNSRLQLAEKLGLPLPNVERAIATLDDEMASVRTANTMKAQAPLLLVADSAQSIVGSIAVEALPAAELSPSERDYVVCRNGAPTLREEPLHQAVRDLCESVLDDLVGESVEDRKALGRHRLWVDFMYPDHAGAVFHGASYELPLALLVWGVANSSPRALGDWYASGRVAGTEWAVRPVASRGVKAEAVKAGLLLLPAEDAEPGTLLARSDRELGGLRESVRLRLERGERVTVGVSDVRVAVFLLYGRRVLS